MTHSCVTHINEYPRTTNLIQSYAHLFIFPHIRMEYYHPTCHPTLIATSHCLPPHTVCDSPLFATHQTVTTTCLPPHTVYYTHTALQREGDTLRSPDCRSSFQRNVGKCDRLIFQTDFLAFSYVIWKQDFQTYHSVILRQCYKSTFCM